MAAEILKKKENLPDEELIALIKTGQTDLYRIIIQRYNQRLYRTAISFGIYDFDSDDLIQQTYINVFEKLDQYRAEAKFSTWLTRIMINECLMYKRKKKTENKRFVDGEKNVTILTPEHQTPEKDYMNKEMKNTLETAIKKLPEKYRVVYVLREIEGISVKECARTLALSEINVKVRLLRAKNLLKNELLKTFNKDEVLTFGNSRCDAVTENVMKLIGKR